MAVATLRTSYWTRTPRVAVFFDSAKPHWDADWHGTVLRIIGAFSETWGGFQWIMIPYSGRPLSDEWKRVLRAYDPDLLAHYGHTYADWAEVDNQGWKERWAGRFEDLGEARDTYVQGRRNDPFTLSWSPEEEPFRFFPPGSLGEILRCTSPFVEELGGEEEVLVNSVTLGNPLLPDTVPVQLLRTIGAGTEVLQPTCDLPGTTLDLIAATFLGRYNHSRLPVLGTSSEGRATLSVKPVPTADLSGHRWAIRERDRGWATGAKRDGLWPFDVTANEHIPFTWLRRAGGGRALENLSLRFVVGSTLEDFCFFYALSRLRPRIVWLPTADEALLKELVEGIYGKPAPVDRTKPALYTSLSLSQEQARGTIEELGWVAANGGEDKLVDTFEGVPLQSVSPATMIPRGLRRRYRLRGPLGEHLGPFFDGVAGTSLSPPIPIAVATLPASQANWVVEFAISGFLPPPRREVSDLLSLAMGGHRHAVFPFERGTVRMSDDGVAVQVPSSMFRSGAPVEDVLLPLQLLRPDDRSVFLTLARATDLTLEPSDKGRYTDEALRVLGGLDEAAEFFRDASREAILTAFLAKEGESGRWVPADGRRVLTSDDIRMVLNTSVEEAATLGDGLILRRAASRGICLRCERCSRATWYPLRALADDFRCVFCQRRQRMLGRSMVRSHPDGSPTIFLRLEEMIAQARTHHCTLTILALRALKAIADRMQSGFHYVTETNLKREGKGLVGEVDFLAVVDGRFILGECKAGEGVASPLERKQAERFGRLSRRLRADVALYVTEADAWSARDISIAERGFASGSVLLRFWAKADLAQNPDYLRRSLLPSP